MSDATLKLLFFFVVAVFLNIKVCSYIVLSPFAFLSVSLTANCR